MISFPVPSAAPMGPTPALPPAAPKVEEVNPVQELSERMERLSLMPATRTYALTDIVDIVQSYHGNPTEASGVTTIKFELHSCLFKNFGFETRHTEKAELETTISNFVDDDVPFPSTVEGQYASFEAV